MFFSQHQLPVSWAGVFVALAGALFCGLQAAPSGVPVPCPGVGCRLFQDFSVYGVSLWWVGTAYFALMALVCLRRARSLAYTLAGLALAADGLLLILMLLTASCVACLGAAAFIGLLFFVIRRHIYSKDIPGPGPSLFLLAWSGLFLAALVDAGVELMEPWQIYGPENAERRVYFSPSCPACRDAITVFAGSAAFIPVAERESDYAAIHGMRAAIAEGKTLAEALAAADSGVALVPWTLETAVHRLKLLRNKAEVLRLGFDKLPLIMVNGMPRSLRPAPESSPPHRDETPQGEHTDAASAELPSELVIIDSCGDGPEPCETPR